ncbi:hypothetical protein B0T10DRAFT_458894 [Thelonectria olida]|uniref:Uncharacterized protein n=1 Tax=Thelonectria olida TaxID=1576542 RepID=A0A9P9ARR8_9HYPO|nr:hypothetical protein B0T10DRAFT_458894 [Thelonectria olida]
MKIRGDVESSVLGLTKCIGALTRYRLTNCLPITALACIATPLALYVVTARLSSLNRELALSHLERWSEFDLASNQSQLDVLVEAVDAFLPEYYGAEWVKETAKHAANLAQSYNQSLLQLGTYLRLNWTVDLCISRRRLPESQDFPLCLRNELGEPDKASLGTKDEVAYSESFDRSKTVDESSECDLEQLLGIAALSIDPSWDDTALFEETTFDEGVTM